jgi:DNA anti-recombination protein RmuC
LLSSFIEKSLFDISDSFATEAFLWMILVVFLFALFEANKGKHSRFLENAPNIMTSLGILGTFIGIVIGLLHFDTDHIDESIKLLLAGLKTAFITSLGGMTAAIFFKGLDSFYFAGKRESSEMPAEATPAHILAELKQSNIGISALKDSLAGAEEGSLVGQVKLARSELSDSHRQRIQSQKEFSERLFGEMRNFADMLSKSATEQVIEALKQVIVDFNKNLTEQFGDNFKRLDESVQKLVVWQQQYMEQLDQMSQQYAEGVKAIGETRDAVGQISAQTATIPVSLEKLRGVIEVNQHQIQELQRHLEAFVTMRDKAIEAVPTINAKLDEVGILIVGAATEMKETLLEGATEFGESVERTNTSMQAIANGIQNQSEKITETLDDTATDISKTARDMLARLGDSAKSLQSNLDSAVEKVMQDVRQSMEKSSVAMEKEVARAVGRTGEGINKQLDALDSAMQDELQRVMTEMGKALATISRRFTDDYERLVQAMNRIVQHRPG